MLRIAPHSFNQIFADTFMACGETKLRKLNELDKMRIYLGREKRIFVTNVCEVVAPVVSF